MTKESLKTFFAQHAVFTWSEVSFFLHQNGTTNITTQKMILRHHIRQGHLLRVRRGLYVSVGAAFTPETVSVDPYLIAGKAVDDSVLGYHTALEYHGYAYSAFFQSAYLTHAQIAPFSFQGHNYISTQFPAALVRQNKEYFACDTISRSGVKIQITSIERTFVDVLDRSNLCGGWEEVIRSLEMIASLDLDKLIQYSVMLNNSTTIARVGYMLEFLQKQFYPTTKQLSILEKHLPKKDHYFDSNQKKDGKYLSRWKLIVPKYILNCGWEEPNVIE